MVALFVMVACGSLEDRCNEADAYLHDEDEHGNVQAEYDYEPEGGEDECADIADGKTEDYDADVIKACSGYVDAVETLETCKRKCDSTDDGWVCG